MPQCTVSRVRVSPWWIPTCSEPSTPSTQPREGLTPEAWLRAAPGQWNSAQILEHLGKAYGSTAYILDKCVTDGAPKGRQPSWRQRVYATLIVDLGYFPTGVAAPGDHAPRRPHGNGGPGVCVRDAAGPSTPRPRGATRGSLPVSGSPITRSSAASPSANGDASTGATRAITCVRSRPAARLTQPGRQRAPASPAAAGDVSAQPHQEGGTRCRHSDVERRPDADLVIASKQDRLAELNRVARAVGDPGRMRTEEKHTSNGARAGTESGFSPSKSSVLLVPSMMVPAVAIDRRDDALHSPAGSCSRAVRDGDRV